LEELYLARRNNFRPARALLAVVIEGVSSLQIQQVLHCQELLSDAVASQYLSG
jgi:hypothetical protein